MAPSCRHRCIRSVINPPILGTFPLESYFCLMPPNVTSAVRMNDSTDLYSVETAAGDEMVVSLFWKSEYYSYQKKHKDKLCCIIKNRSESAMAILRKTVVLSKIYMIPNYLKGCPRKRDYSISFQKAELRLFSGNLRSRIQLNTCTNLSCCCGAWGVLLNPGAMRFSSGEKQW